MLEKNKLPESTPDSGRNITPPFVYSDLEWSEEAQPEFNRGSRGGRKAAYRLLAWSWAAAVIDTLVVLGFLCLLIAGLAMSFGSSSIASLESSRLQMQAGGVAMLIAMYMVLLRSFLGFTLGEWACGLRLGFLAQRLDKFYALKVIARTVLIFSTGLIVFPILSILFGKDLIGEVLNLPLIEKI
jgi:hypothetical protein